MRLLAANEGVGLVQKQLLLPLLLLLLLLSLLYSTKTLIFRSHI